MPDVSVIIVTRNTCELTRTAVCSVLESRDALAKEIIVVDNGSTDESPRALPREFPGLKYIHSTVNLGFARANNLGAKQATGEFLLLLNSDARLKPDTLQQAVRALREHRDWAVVGVQLLNPDGSPQNSIANAPSLATELLNKSLLRRFFPRRFPGKEHRFSAPAEVESVIGAFMLVRASAWHAIGGFDERFFFFFEETDFCCQVRRRGWKVMHLPKAEAWHDQGGSARQMPAAARIEYWRSRYSYFRKNFGAFTRGVLRLGLCARLFVDWLSAVLLVAVTLGQSGKWLQRLRTQTTLWQWHLRLCPADMGLSR